MMDENGQRTLLLALWQAAVGAAGVAGRLAPFLPPVPPGRTVVIGAGKAAAAMAGEIDRLWPGPLAGVVVTRDGHGLPQGTGRIEVLEAGHPVPDRRSVAAGARMAGLMRELGRDDQAIALMSGGASALLVGLPDGVTLADKQAVTRQLLACGAPIRAINTVRRHISAIKGGRLAAMAGAAPVLTLAVSDIPGDAVADIGSGPTVADGSTPAEALAILRAHRIAVPEGIALHLAKSGAQAAAPRLADRAHVVVRPADAFAAAAQRANAAGFEPVLLGDDLEGEARQLGRTHARLALDLLGRGRRACILSGGETTVTVRGEGRGGRNGEYLLAMALELDGRHGIAALAADTDGLDGTGDNAGALVFPSSLDRAARCGLDGNACLAGNDSHPFFAATDDLLVTGPTRTNVNDFRAILVDPG